MARPRTARLLLVLLTVCALGVELRATDPPVLTYADLVALFELEPSEALQQKLQGVLTTPVVRNLAPESASQPVRPVGPDGRPMLRVAQWNVERGQRLDDILAVLTGRPAAAAAAAE